jgi:hypothetical protein
MNKICSSFAAGLAFTCLTANAPAQAQEPPLYSIYAQPAYFDDGVEVGVDNDRPATLAAVQPRTAIRGQRHAAVVGPAAIGPHG